MSVVISLDNVLKHYSFLHIFGKLIRMMYLSMWDLLPFFFRSGEKIVRNLY